MSVHTTQQVRTYRTLTPEPVATQMFTTRSMSPVSPLTQVSSISTGLPVTAVNGSYESMSFSVLTLCSGFSQLGVSVVNMVKRKQSTCLNVLFEFSRSNWKSSACFCDTKL
ncbi:hypothetical protein GOODEAATRI_021818 [Goodea atripinnis]|uniref:Uncharacterized protein n=1 Tax=Goodea atripinnis TaxID=208336 RepID=A0ABV0PQN8_9TELE